MFFVPSSFSFFFPICDEIYSEAPLMFVRVCACVRASVCVRAGVGGDSSSYTSRKVNFGPHLFSFPVVRIYKLGKKIAKTLISLPRLSSAHAHVRTRARRSLVLLNLHREAPQRTAAVLALRRPPSLMGFSEAPPRRCCYFAQGVT